MKAISGSATTVVDGPRRPDRDERDDPDDPGDPDDPTDPIDSFEQLLRHAVAAPPIPPTFAAGHVVANRYVIDGVLGVGGMGTVYRATDRTLDREVALKLHRIASDFDRLRREALAMAKLAHPNVVTVYEVGEVDGRTFVAMEYVAGTTLRAWLETPRRPREIIRAIAAAGQGLAAAHAAGLVHRDIKPDNIFVGDDGRVRVGDFGLARIERSERPPEERGSRASPIGDATVTGTVLGTPAYMAPEQIDGGELDGRTDQFALAVVAWEALGGSRPFGGETTAELYDAIKGQVPVPVARRIPSRIRRVLLRAMAKSPDDRYRDIPTFLDALQAAERRPRQLAIAAVALVATGGIATAALWPQPDPLAACATIPEGPALLEDRAMALVPTIARSGAAHAADRSALVGQAIHELQARHTSASRTACEARVTGRWAPVLVDASRECLATRTRTAHELLATLPVTAQTVPDIVQLAARLPTFASCTDPAVLSSWQPLVPVGGDFEAAVTARARLEVAHVLLELGRIAEARAIHDDIARQPIAKTSVAVARRLELAKAALAGTIGEYANAERALGELYFAARADDDRELALRAVAELVTLVAGVRRDRTGGEHWIQNALADAQREHARLPDLAALALTRAADATAKAGDNALALTRADRARELVANVGSTVLDAAVEDVRVGALGELGKIDEAIAASDVQIERLSAALGAHHPAVAAAFSRRLTVLTRAGRADPALAAARRARAIVDSEGVSSGVSLARAQITLGAGLLLARDPDAGAYLESARASLVAAFGEDHADVALVDSNLALIYLDRGERERALVALRHAVAIQERTLGSDHTELAASLYNLAVAERDAKHYDAALETARRCEAIFAARMRASPRHIFALVHIAMIQNLAGRPELALASAELAIQLAHDKRELMGPAWARLEAARALVASKRDRARARQLLLEAREQYAAVNMPARVAEVEAMLAKLR